MANVKKQPLKTKKQRFLARVKNPLFLSAAAGFVYTLYEKTAPHYGLPEVSLGDFQLGVDLLAYALIGTGVYSTFGQNKK